MRNVIAFLAAVSPIVVLVAGSLALGMAVATRDWKHACLVVIVVSIYMLIEVRRG